MLIEVKSWALYSEQLQKAKPKQQQIEMKKIKSNEDKNKQKEVKSYEPRGFTGSN